MTNFYVEKKGIVKEKGLHYSLFEIRIDELRSATHQFLLFSKVYPH